MRARFTVLSETPIVSAMAGCVSPFFSQQHHLNALTLNLGNLSMQRLSQLANLAFRVLTICP
jgi:hypothetical protein